MERKLISEADSRPLVVLDPRAPASQDALDAAVRAAALADRALRPPQRLLAAAARRPPRPRRSRRTCWRWPAAHVRLALLDESHRPGAGRGAEPPRARRASSPPGSIDRPPRGLGRTPGGCLLVVPGALPNRRAVLEVAGCQGFLAARTGAAAAMAAVAGERLGAPTV